MKISEVCRLCGVTVSAAKYYVREQLVHEGVRVGANQTSYDESHVRRLRLVRALIETGGLSIAAAKRVLSELDSSERSMYSVFQAAEHAIGVGGASVAQPGSEVARGRIAALVAEWGWAATLDNPGLDFAARALDGYTSIGFDAPHEYLAAYADAAATIARADLLALATREHPDLIAELMVVGTVLGDALLAGIRRLALQNEAAALFPPTETTQIRKERPE